AVQRRFDPDGGLHNDHIGLLFDDLLRHSGSIDIAGDPAIIGADISAGHPAKGLQPFTKRGCMALSFCIIRAPHPYDDLPHPLALLRTRRERPGRRAAEQRDEFAAFHVHAHSITSSARPSSVSGTVRPNALAVLRLTISSTLVDCWTGRSPARSPLRIRPA